MFNLLRMDGVGKARLIFSTGLTEGSALRNKGATGVLTATGDLIHGQAMALKQLWSLTWREAQVQTFADAFRGIAVCCVIATVMVPLLRKVAPPTAPSADAH